MMLRLQREKAEVQMELRQFRRFAYEKMALDAAEIDQLRALLSQRAPAGEAASSEAAARGNPSRHRRSPGPAPPARAPSSPPARAAPTAAAAMAQPLVVKKDDDLG